MNTDGDVLFVCSGGGHLRQLAGFADRLGIEKEQQVWVTFRNGLSESLLADRRVEYVPFTAPRDLRALFATGGEGTEDLEALPVESGDQHRLEPCGGLPAVGCDVGNLISLHRKRGAR